MRERENQQDHKGTTEENCSRRKKEDGRRKYPIMHKSCAPDLLEATAKFIPH